MKAFAIYDREADQFLRQYRHYKYHLDDLPTLFDTIEKAKSCLSGLKGYRTYRTSNNWKLYGPNIDNLRVVEIRFVRGDKEL